MTPQPDKLEATAHELLALREKATPGPWHVHPDIPDWIEPNVCIIWQLKNASFIAAAHRMADCIAALLAERAALQARCEAVEKDAALGAYLRPLIVWQHGPGKQCSLRIGSQSALILPGYLPGSLS